MRQNQNFAERYHTAVLLLMAKQGGYLRLDRTEQPYGAFFDIIEFILRPHDYEPHASELRRGRGEPRWHHGLREALWHMKDENDPRVEKLSPGFYRVTDKGWEHLRNAEIPLQLLDMEVENLPDGVSEVRYIHPVNGHHVVTFTLGSSFEEL